MRGTSGLATTSRASSETNRALYLALKRVIDVTIALTAILALAPLLVSIAFALALMYRTSPIFRHKRIGLNGQPFYCLKFRSMAPDAAAILSAFLEANPHAKAEWEANHKLKNDPRVTVTGRFLRSTSLDELPQLINVVKGDMSIVGPRPIVDEEAPKYGDAFQIYTSVRPGLTGLWQISGRSNTDYQSRVRLDVQYVSEANIKTDISIMFLTLPAVLLKRGSC